MTVRTLILGQLSSNCYIVDCGEVCAIIDIGDDAEKLLHYLKTYTLKPAAVLLTHGHFDHVGGVEEVRLATGAKVYIHEADSHMLNSGTANLAEQISDKPFQPVKEFETFKNGDCITVGNVTFTVMHTPGHTSGSVCFLTENLLFSGDTLFRCSIGRTDLGGNGEEMEESLSKLSRMEGEYRVYPGHFHSTMLSFEKENNPYLR